MPELPEVESVRRALSARIAGRRVEEVRLLRAEVIAHPAAAEFSCRLRGLRLGEMGRRGKFLHVPLSGGWRLTAHLRMTGRLLLAQAGEPLEAHTHVALCLEGGEELRLVDQRRFGRLWLFAADEPDSSGVSRLGLEPDDPLLCGAYLRRRLGRSRRAIKACLLDQGVVAGIGNIYSDEILFAAGIRPDRPASALTPAQWDLLAAEIARTMRFFTDLNEVPFEVYRRSAGLEYRNTPYLRVYARAGEPCVRCGTPLARSVVGGRASVWCPRCQG